MVQSKVNYEDELLNDIASFSNDPYGFVLYAYPWGEGELKDFDGPDEWQAEQLKYIGDQLKAGEITNFEDVIRMATVSGHGVGKSCEVAWLIDWAISTREDTRGIVTANTDTQLRTKTWPELQKWHRLSICSHWFECTATAIYSKDSKHEKTWRIDAIPWSIANTEAFAGLHNQGKRILIIFDEASKIADKIFEVTEGALTDKNTQIICCLFGNGTQATGRFRECWRKYRSLWTTYEIDSRNARMSNKKQIQEWIDTYGIDSDFVKVRVRGMFPNVSAKQFISTEDVDKAYGAHLRDEQYNFAPKIITVDPAWEGDDELIIGLRQGLAFKILRACGKNDNDIQIANVVANLEDEEHADAVFIDGGFGTGIVSAGKTMGRNWTIVWFSGTSSDQGCLNKRAEMWKLGRDWLKEGGVIPQDQVLYNDLIGPETVPRLDGKIQLESKQDMKARGIPSPNRGDALMLSFAYPVRKKNRNIGPSNLEYCKNDYDPFKKGW
jgi:hypothetical protein